MWLTEWRVGVAKILHSGTALTKTFKCNNATFLISSLPSEHVCISVCAFTSVARRRRGAAPGAWFKPSRAYGGGRSAVAGPIIWQENVRMRELFTGQLGCPQNSGCGLLRRVPLSVWAHYAYSDPFCRRTTQSSLLASSSSFRLHRRH